MKAKDKIFLLNRKFVQSTTFHHCGKPQFSFYES